MKIKTDSWHYKVWAATFTYAAPEYTDLCRYCQRVFFRLISTVLLALMGAALLGALVYAVFVAIVKAPLAVLFGVMVGALVLYLGWAYMRWLDKTPPVIKDTDGPLIAWLKAAKLKVCPLIRFDLPEDED